MGWSCVWSSELVRRGWRFPYSSPGKGSCSFYGQCHVHFQASASGSASISCSESSSVFPSGPELHPKSSSWFQGPHPMPAAGLLQLALTRSNKEEQPSSLVAHSVGTRPSQSPETSSEFSPGSYCDLIQAGC